MKSVIYDSTGRLIPINSLSLWHQSILLRNNNDTCLFDR